MCAEQNVQFDPNSCDYPVYAVEGGYARREDSHLVWLSGIPLFVHASIGDHVPNELRAVPANDRARELEGMKRRRDDEEWWEKQQRLLDPDHDVDSDF